MGERLSREGSFAGLAADLSAVPNDDDSGVRLIDLLVRRAADLRVSDIHVWPEAGGYALAVRRDGSLHRVLRLPREAGRLLIGRARVLCRLPSSDEGLPQDGSFAFDAAGRDAGVAAGPQSVRASFFPVMRGVRLVLRLPEQELDLRLETLGYPEPLQEALRALVHRRDGLFLATGPAGSGKTTTLYTLLVLLLEGATPPNVMTLEDPIEREVPGATQTNLRPERGFDYAEAIRSVLRQDPDVLMLGEIRDPDSARMAARLALTGHLVLSTLHAGRAARIPPRLEELGVPEHLWRPTLLAALAQRLMRRLCRQCRRSAPAPSDAPPNLATASGFREPAGCDACQQTGFVGRIPVAELWLPAGAEDLLPSGGGSMPGAGNASSGALWPPGGLDAAAWSLASEGEIAIDEWQLST